jgi:hypothetical protein
MQGEKITALEQRIYEDSGSDHVIRGRYIWYFCRAEINKKIRKTCLKKQVFS